MHLQGYGHNFKGGGGVGSTPPGYKAKPIQKKDPESGLADLFDQLRKCDDPSLARHFESTFAAHNVQLSDEDQEVLNSLFKKAFANQLSDYKALLEQNPQSKATVYRKALMLEKELKHRQLRLTREDHVNLYYLIKASESDYAQKLSLKMKSWTASADIASQSEAVKAEMKATLMDALNDNHKVIPLIRKFRGLNQNDKLTLLNLLKGEPVHFSKLNHAHLYYFNQPIIVAEKVVHDNEMPIHLLGEEIENLYVELEEKLKTDWGRHANSDSVQIRLFNTVHRFLDVLDLDYLGDEFYSSTIDKLLVMIPHMADKDQQVDALDLLVSKFDLVRLTDEQRNEFGKAILDQASSLIVVENDTRNGAIHRTLSTLFQAFVYKAIAYDEEGSKLLRPLLLALNKLERSMHLELTEPPEGYEGPAIVAPAEVADDVELASGSSSDDESLELVLEMIDAFNKAESEDEKATIGDILVGSVKNSDNDDTVLPALINRFEATSLLFNIIKYIDDADRRDALVIRILMDEKFNSSTSSEETVSFEDAFKAIYRKGVSDQKQIVQFYRRLLDPSNDDALINCLSKGEAISAVELLNDELSLFLSPQRKTVIEQGLSTLRKIPVEAKFSESDEKAMIRQLFYQHQAATTQTQQDNIDKLVAGFMEPAENDETLLPLILELANNKSKLLETVSTHISDPARKQLLAWKILMHPATEFVPETDLSEEKKQLFKDLYKGSFIDKTQPLRAKLKLRLQLYKLLLDPIYDQVLVEEFKRNPFDQVMELLIGKFSLFIDEARREAITQSLIESKQEAAAVRAAKVEAMSTIGSVIEQLKAATTPDQQNAAFSVLSDMMNDAANDDTLLPEIIRRIKKKQLLKMVRADISSAERKAVLIERILCYPETEFSSETGLPAQPDKVQRFKELFDKKYIPGKTFTEAEETEFFKLLLDPVYDSFLLEKLQKASVSSALELLNEDLNLVLPEDRRSVISNTLTNSESIVNEIVAQLRLRDPGQTQIVKTRIAQIMGDPSNDSTVLPVLLKSAVAHKFLFGIIREHIPDADRQRFLAKRVINYPEHDFKAEQDVLAIPGKIELFKSMLDRFYIPPAVKAEGAELAEFFKLLQDPIYNDVLLEGLKRMDIQSAFDLVNGDFALFLDVDRQAAITQTLLQSGGAAPVVEQDPSPSPSDEHAAYVNDLATMYDKAIAAKASEEIAMIEGIFVEILSDAANDETVIPAIIQGLETEFLLGLIARKVENQDRKDALTTRILQETSFGSTD